MTERRERVPRKQQQRSLKTKKKLLDAALEAFSENGFKGTSTRDIAARAGVHHPLITYHFRNKEELWRAAADHVFRDFFASLRHLQQDMATECPKTRVAAMIKTYVSYAARYPAIHKVILQEAGQPSGRLDWLVDNYLKPLSDVAIREIADLQDKGVAPPGDPALLFNMIRASSGGLIALALELKGSSNIDLTDPEMVESLGDMIIRVFLPGIPAREAAQA